MPGDVDCRPLEGHFTSLGFGENDTLWPRSNGSFSGYQLLLEYLPSARNSCLPACVGWKPWLFRLNFPGLRLRWCWPNAGRMTSALPKASASELRAGDQPVPAGIRSPDAELATDRIQLRPMRVQDGHTEIYAVDSVISSSGHSYVPFSSFRHKGGMMRHGAPEYYYHPRAARPVRVA